MHTWASRGSAGYTRTDGNSSVNYKYVVFNLGFGWLLTKCFYFLISYKTRINKYMHVYIRIYTYAYSEFLFVFRNTLGCIVVLWGSKPHVRMCLVLLLYCFAYFTCIWDLFGWSFLFVSCMFSGGRDIKIWIYLEMCAQNPVPLPGLFLFVFYH